MSKASFACCKLREATVNHVALLPPTCNQLRFAVTERGGVVEAANARGTISDAGSVAAKLEEQMVGQKAVTKGRH